MKSLTYGTIPEDLEISEPYRMDLNSNDFDAAAAIVNQGIDSHLEAVFTKQDGSVIHIQDSASMRCFLRRCVEDGLDSNACNLASSIMSTLDYEWI